MRFIEIEGKCREETGKSYARKVRSQGLLPAILYGPGVEVTKLLVDKKKVEKDLLGRQEGFALWKIKINDGDGVREETAMVKEMQKAVMTEHLLHVDFYRADPDKDITAEVPIRLIGTPKASEGNSVLQQMKRDLKVECRPAHIPGVIEVNVEELEPGDSVHVRDLTLAEEIKIVDQPDDVLATLQVIAEEEVPVEETEEELAEGEGEGETEAKPEE